MEEKYQKVTKIGSGTFGEAWLVNSICSGRSYVMKEVRISGMTEDELMSTHREAEVLARCKHINIIRYKESFIKDSFTVCLVMEYADGGDLFEKEKEAIAMDSQIPEETVMDWFIQVIFAVHYLHNNNILHRDLKTQNIFLTRCGIIKVGDFGIARLLRSKQELATTAIGTPYYLSPEICQRKPYNHRSDMWALGCILYELCALKHPFEANDFQSLIFKILMGIYEPLNSVYSKLVHDLVSVLLRTNPERRPTADQLLLIPGLRKLVDNYIQRYQGYMEKHNSDIKNEGIRISEETVQNDGISSPSSNKKVNRSHGTPNSQETPTLFKNKKEKDNMNEGDIFYESSANPSKGENSEIKPQNHEPGRRDSQTQTPDWSKKNNRLGQTNEEESPLFFKRRKSNEHVLSPLQVCNFLCQGVKELFSGPDYPNAFTPPTSKDYISKESFCLNDIVDNDVIMSPKTDYNNKKHDKHSANAHQDHKFMESEMHDVIMSPKTDYIYKKSDKHSANAHQDHKFMESEMHDVIMSPKTDYNNKKHDKHSANAHQDHKFMESEMYDENSESYERISSPRPHNLGKTFIVNHYC